MGKTKVAHCRMFIHARWRNGFPLGPREPALRGVGRLPPTGSTRNCSNARFSAGWGERNHCKMVAIPTLAQENAKRPNRE
jgi:hypothetical protein